MTSIEKYIWVVNALYKAGERGLSFQELSQRWLNDDGISCGMPLVRQTFDRWKGHILMSLGVNIECRLKGGYRYYISNPEVLATGQISQWLLDTYSTANTLSQNTALKDRIIVEDIPSSHGVLQDVIAAMRDNQIIKITHHAFNKDRRYTLPVAPYCLKMLQKRWYMLALSIKQDRVLVYGLDRIEKVSVTDKKFSLPEDFDAQQWFSTYFGIVMNDSVPVQRIVIRAYKTHQHYLRSLPLHHSQKEIFTSKEYADFELYLRPTYDFCMTLLHFGNMIEVMEPASLRKVMHDWVGDLWKYYKNDK